MIARLASDSMNRRARSKRHRRYERPTAGTGRFPPSGGRGRQASPFAAGELGARSIGLLKAHGHGTYNSRCSSGQPGTDPGFPGRLGSPHLKHEEYRNENVSGEDSVSDRLVQRGAGVSACSTSTRTLPVGDPAAVRAAEEKAKAAEERAEAAEARAGRPPCIAGGGSERAGGAGCDPQHHRTAHGSPRSGEHRPARPGGGPAEPGDAAGQRRQDGGRHGAEGDQ